jgi:hypothetical protein
MEAVMDSDGVTKISRRGRPRIKIDQDKWGWLDFEGGSVPDMATALGVSKRTLQRRKRQRRLEAAPTH